MVKNNLSGTSRVVEWLFSFGWRNCCWKNFTKRAWGNVVFLFAQKMTSCFVRTCRRQRANDEIKFGLKLLAMRFFCGHTRELDTLTWRDITDRLSSVATISTTHMMGKLFFFDCVLQFTHPSPPKSPHPVLTHLKLLSTLMMYLCLMMKTMMDWKYTVVTLVCFWKS